MTIRIDTYQAVARLLSRQATVKKGRLRLVGSQVAELTDALEPHNLTEDLRETIETALHAYKFRGAERAIYAHFKAHQQPIYRRRLEAAIALRNELHSVNDRKLMRKLDHSIAGWSKMAALIPNRQAHRPAHDDLQELGVAVTGALERAGVPLTLGRVRSKTVYMDVLDVVRTLAEPDIAPRGSYAYARRVRTAYRTVSKTTT